MKGIVDEYLKILLYTIFGIVLIMSSYMIILNIHHSRALSNSIVVSEVDNDYTNYKKNINEIENYLNKYSNDSNRLFTSLKKTLAVLKNGGVFRLIPNSKIEYHDLYELNDYFTNDIINQCWIENLKGSNKNKVYDEMIDVLANNSTYLNDQFIDNGLMLYDSVSESKIQNNYKAILKNYLSFSNIILDMSKSLGG